MLSDYISKGTSSKVNMANQQKDNRFDKFIISNEEIHSLDELRAHFDAEHILNAFGDGSLLRFLKTHYYEREYEILSKLSLEKKDCLKIICEVIGVDYLKQDFVLTTDVLQRLNRIKQYTDSEEVLNNFRKVVFDQEELANLLNGGETTIYLCHGKFSVPLSKKGITYIGIDNPTIENAFTMQQYKHAGITVENISLPANVPKEMSDYALNIAKKNGYDGYYENHSPLATYFHNKLKNYKRFSCISLPYDFSAITEEFRSEFTARQELVKYLKTPYDAACGIMDIKHSECIAKKTAEKYSDAVRFCFQPVMEQLKELCLLKGKPEIYDELCRLVSSCKQIFTETFEEEIRDNQDYYGMYDFNYFVDNVTIERYDYRITTGFLKFAETLLPGKIEYSYSNFFDTIYEMERDINNRASSFYKCAYNEYLSYVRKIEKMIEALGDNYPEFEKNETVSDYLTRVTHKK